MDKKIRVIFADKTGSSKSKTTLFSEQRDDEEEDLSEQERLLLQNATDTDFPFNNETVVNPHNFKWIILEKSLCDEGRRRPFILIVVHSAPKNWRQRMFIRETWGAADLTERLDTLVVFALGAFRGLNAARQQKAVLRENSVYRDIIQVLVLILCF